MNERQRSAKATTRTDEKTPSLDTSKTRPMAAPASDPTNPYQNEPSGDWAANERAAERRNNEPGLTDGDRKQRRW